MTRDDALRMIRANGGAWEAGIAARALGLPK